jgi:para-aminobenzoate synthetase component I
MTYSHTQAIEIMNNWGAAKVPFLFIIDYEMKAIQLFRLDNPLPGNISVSFNQAVSAPKYRDDFIFLKQPVSFSKYRDAFDVVRENIMGGNSFLVNLTFPTRLETNLTLQEIYNYSEAKYKLIIDDEFVCFSPETFVTIRDGYISSFPMKGTIKASVPDAEKQILQNPKETAEHHTIVDLIRNDLSMVAGEISVKKFRYIDTLVTNEGELLQVSSEIIGKLEKDYRTRLGNILFALLPAGSITGAPKRKTMEIIREVEKEDRGYYTGVFGRFDGENVDSAVMIRFIEKRKDELWFRSGGGITCNSEVKAEYEELINKVYVPIV